MPLTNAQVNAFFTDPAQMGIPQATFKQLAEEGITTVDDLIDSDDDALKQLAENLRKPGGQVPVDEDNPGPSPKVVLGPCLVSRVLFHRYQLA